MANVDSTLNELLQKEGLQHFGWTPLTRPLSLDYYKAWLKEGLHGSMAYLETHYEMKETPKKLFAQAKSAIVVAVNYLPHPTPHKPVANLRLARYARGEDYHHWFKKKLEAVIHSLEKAFPNEAFIAYTDSAPVLERDLAYRAGLGWVGKNTCLINEKRGSLFLLGEIYTSLDIQNSSTPAPDRCGTCTRCIEACPTQAIEAPRKIDARKCISFLTIESKTSPGLDLRSRIGDWFFGCDICQTVCPWNEKVFGPLLVEKPSSREDIVTDLKMILSSSGKQLERIFQGTPLTRASSFGLRRNALVVIANLKLTELRSHVEVFLTDARLSELASWTLQQLEN